MIVLLTAPFRPKRARVQIDGARGRERGPRLLHDVEARRHQLHRLLQVDDGAIQGCVSLDHPVQSCVDLGGVADDLLLGERQLVEHGVDVGDAGGVGLPRFCRRLVGFRRRRNQLPEIGDRQLRHLHSLSEVQSPGSRRCDSCNSRRTDLGYTEGVLREFTRNPHPSFGFINRESANSRFWGKFSGIETALDTTCYVLDRGPRVTHRYLDHSLEFGYTW